MNPAKVIRENVRIVTDLPNIGPAMAADLKLLGIHAPEDLRGRCPYAMYDELCRITQQVHDPCVIDIFISITKFMEGDVPNAWWAYTAERKRTYHR